MKAYLWEGPKVLKRYGAGVALVIAADQREAWVKLRQADREAEHYLATGNTIMCWDNEPAFELDEDDLKAKPGFPIQPKEIEIADLKPVIKWGSE